MTQLEAEKKEKRRLKRLRLRKNKAEKKKSLELGLGGVEVDESTEKTDRNLNPSSDEVYQDEVNDALRSDPITVKFSSTAESSSDESIISGGIDSDSDDNRSNDNRSKRRKINPTEDNKKSARVTSSPASFKYMM